MRPAGRLPLVCLAVVGLGGLGGLAGLAGCWQRPARTVHEAHERFRHAVARGDAAALYLSLDQQSQWSVLTTQRYYREVQAVVQQSYPPAARARELERTAGAEAEKPEQFFAAQATRRGWLKRFTAGAAPAAQVSEQGRTAVVTAGGTRFAFAYTDKGGWGFAGLQAELDDMKRRASHDVDMAKENARVYQQAGGGGSAAP